MSYAPCTECRRHVRSTDAACPFCGAVGARAGGSQALPKSRLSRSAILAFATSVAACGGSESTETKTDTGTVTDTGGTTADTGSTTDTGTTTDSGLDTLDTGSPVAAYGGPFDTGVADSSSTKDTGGSASDGGGAPLYGAPPSP